MTVSTTSKKQIRITCKGAALVPINKLEPLQPESFKTLSTKDYGRLKAAILDVGFSFPELVWKHRDRFYIVDGHQRVRTVQQMIKEGHALPGRKLPVSFTEARNKKEALKKIGMGTSQYGKYDEESMYEFMHVAGLELSDLKEWSSLPQIHMGKLEMGYFKDLDLDGADDVPELPKKAVTRLADLWELGEHRLLCGDSTKRESYNGGFVDAVLTDPPYGISQEGVPNDEPEKLAGIVEGAIANLPIKNSVVIAFQSTRTFPVWLNAVLKAGHKFERMLWLYKAAQCTFPWRGWILKSESILASSLGEPKWQDVKPYSHDCYYLSEVSGELDKDLGWHGSVKPLSVVADLLQRITPQNGMVCDPFLGSGTTLIAAEKLNRHCYGIEIEPRYCDVIVERWQQFSGGKAKRVKAK